MFLNLTGEPTVGLSVALHARGGFTTAIVKIHE